MRARMHGNYEVKTVRQLDLESFAPQAARNRFGHMFPDLASDPNSLLPESPATVAELQILGSAMVDTGPAGNASLPAILTYFGQFIDHDITAFDDKAASGKFGIDPNLELPKPVAPDEAARLVENGRTAKLDLDSVYEGLGRDPGAREPNGKRVIGPVTPVGAPVPGKDEFNDLPRRRMWPSPRTPEQDAVDREALIGDPRNDENLVVAQLHLAFLRAHNALMERELSERDATRGLRRRYQAAVRDSFLARICAPDVFDDVFGQGNIRFFKIETEAELFMPFEFAVAAYRFGHSMIRHNYNHNEHFTQATLEHLFTFTALSGTFDPILGTVFDFETLPQNWVIQWERYVGPTFLNRTRKIDTFLAPPVFGLPGTDGKSLAGVLARLATRNLLRGYVLSVPTGQAIARRMGLTPMTPQELLDAVPSDAQRASLRRGNFDEHTPLWFYILAEAAGPLGAGGTHLGPVGSLIVAETFFNLLKFSDDSIIAEPLTAQEADTGEFSLEGILRLSGNFA